MTNVYESSIQAGQHLAHLADIYVANCVILVTVVFVQFNQESVLKHRNAEALLGRVDYQLDIHVFKFKRQGALQKTEHAKSQKSLLLLVTVLSETFLLLVHRHLVAFALFTARHNGRGYELICD